MNEQPIGERVAKVEERVEQLREDIYEMKTALLPETNRTIEAMAEEMRAIRDKVMTRSTDVGWAMRIMSFFLRDLLTPLLLVWVAYILSAK